MGDMGSGRHWYWDAKDTTTDYNSIDVRRWKRDGLLTPHQSFGWQWSRNGTVALPFCYLRLSHMIQLLNYPKEIKSLGDHLLAKRLDKIMYQRKVGKIIGADEFTVHN